MANASLNYKVGGVKKGPKHAYVIFEWSLKQGQWTMRMAIKIFNFGRSLTIFLCSYDFYVMTTRPSLTFLQHGYIRQQMTPAIDRPSWQARAGRLAGWLSELADEKGWFLCRAATFFPAHAKKTDKIESSEKSHHDNWMGSRPDQDGMHTVLCNLFLNWYYYLDWVLFMCIFERFESF